MKKVINEATGQEYYTWENETEMYQLRYKAMKLINQHLKDAGIKVPEDHRYDKYRPI